MADVLPFAGTRFNTKEKQLDLSKIIAPPFDIIDSVRQKDLHERDPHNMVRLSCGFEAPGDDDLNNRYVRAAETYKSWKAQGLLTDEQRKCFYVYEHEFTLPNHKKRFKRRGYFGLVKLQDYRSGKIRAHELTFEEPRLDRLRLLKACQVNLEPLFILYKDEEHEVDRCLSTAVEGKANEEIIDVKGDAHRLWLMHKKEPILQINQAMKNKRLYIADGHHRYETALQYRDEMREMTGRRDGRQPYDFIMMYLNNADDEALFTTATHRVLARDLGADVDLEEVLDDLGEYFEIKEFKIDLANMDKSVELVNKHLEAKKGVKVQFVMVLPGGKGYELRLKKAADLDEMVDGEFMSELLKQQDLMILHRFVIARGWLGNPEIELDHDDIFYCREIPQALDLVRRRKGCVAFLMNPIEKETITQIAENGELLPHNSTYFYPKIQSGFVLRDLQVGFG
ncbi:DUF1015 family protein [bacterium]|nr:DUF1015 family protein [bacterium]